LNLYRVDVRDVPKGERAGQPVKPLAKDVTFNCDMWDLPEEVLILKLTLATQEMGQRENRRKYDFRLPERDYDATVKKVTRTVVVTESVRTIATRA
jgi:hypothetical protein